MIALEISGLLTTQPTGIAVYASALTRALLRPDAGRFELTCPWSRRRQRLSDPTLEARRGPAYLSGRVLERRYALLHALDTRLPRAYRGPLVATLYDTMALQPDHRQLGLATARFRRRKARAYEAIARRADVIVTLSEAVRREALERLPVRGRVIVVPPGVPELPPVTPGSLARLAALGVEPPYVLTVGALCARKNLETCARAVQFLARQEPRVRLVVVGGATREWAGSRGERALAAAGSLVVLAGYLDNDLLAAAYSRASALLHLAHHEGFGLTVLEALAAGVPVVASDRGGLREAGGQAAWLVDPLDAEGAAAALALALAPGDEVRRRQELGREHCRTLSWDAAAARLFRIHSEVLAARGTVAG